MGALARPFTILGPWRVTRICDSPDGARILADELNLSPGLVSTVKKECDDPGKRARRIGGLNPEPVLTIPGMLQPATTLTGQVANIADTVMNSSTMMHDNQEERAVKRNIPGPTTSPYDATFDSLDDSALVISGHLLLHRPGCNHHRSANVCLIRLKQ